MSLAYRITPIQFFIRDHAPFDRSAVLAGMIKESAHDLQRTIASIARLTSIVAPSDEVKARKLLETLINAKRAYVRAEDRRRSV